MAASLADLIRWFKEGKEQKATHMIVVCDTFDWDDYPVYVKPDENVQEVGKKYGLHGEVNMQRVTEVYDLSKDMEGQMKPGSRVFNY